MTETTYTYVTIEPEELHEPRYADTFRIKVSEGSFEIAFGRTNPPDGDQVKVNVVSKVVLSDEKMYRFVLSLVRSMMDYEEQYSKRLFADEPKPSVD